MILPLTDDITGLLSTHPRLLDDAAVRGAIEAAELGSALRDVAAARQRLDAGNPGDPPDAASRDRLLALLRRLPRVEIPTGRPAPGHRTGATNRAAVPAAVAPPEPAVGGGSPAPLAGDRSGIVWGDAITEVAVEYVWPGVLAIGEITVLVGDAGAGKSLIVSDVVARVTVGLPWPGGGPARAPAGAVLLDAENHPRTTLAPRLRVAGADATRWAILPAGVTLADLHRFEVAVGEVRARCGRCDLVTVDPLSAYWPVVCDPWRGEQVRRVLGSLVDLARRLRFAVLIVDHPSKGGERSYLHRVANSVAVAALPRHVYRVGSGSAGVRVLAATKCNMGGAAPLTYRIDEAPAGVPRIFWGQAGAEAGDSDGDVEWLRGVLAVGPLLRSEIERRARVAGIGRVRLATARTAAGVVVYRDPPQRGPYWWRLPGPDIYEA